MSVQWWCSAQGVAWSWTWRPYPGVWLVIALVASLYVWLWRRHPGRPGDGARRRPAAVAGVALLWIALDWPVGTLGAGYLASVHMVQFILIVMLAPPLLIGGLPRYDDTAMGRRSVPRMARALTTPLLALALSAALVVATHTPPVVDALMGSQVGSCAIDVAWIVAGLLFWWPVLSPGWPRPRLVAPLALPYLLVGMLPDKAVSAWLLLSRFPAYRTYELAPPIPGTSANADQAVAGGIMLLAGMIVLFASTGATFFLWNRAEERADPAVLPAGEAIGR